MLRALRSPNAFRAARRCLGSVPGSANAFRASLAARPVSLQFALIPSAVVTQVMAAAGADAICIDLEHGPIDYKDVQAMVGSMRGSGAAPVVRVPSIEPLSVNLQTAASETPGKLPPSLFSSSVLLAAVGMWKKILKSMIELHLMLFFHW